jgi:TRAP-type C4-dicarboxylate transport system permease small subunit
MIEAVCRGIDRLCLGGAVVAAIAVSWLAVMLIAESVLTAWFSFSQPWATEWSGYLCAVTLFAGSGYALRAGAHIRVELYSARLPPGAARWVDFGCTLFALGVAGVLCYGLTMLAWTSYVVKSVSYFSMQTPLAIPQAFLAASVWLLCFALVARLLRLVTGRAPEDAVKSMTMAD